MCGDFGVGGGGWGGGPGTCLPSFQITNFFIFFVSGCTVSAGYINFRNLVDMINVKINFFNVELGSPFVPR